MAGPHGDREQEKRTSDAADLALAAARNQQIAAAHVAAIVAGRRPPREIAITVLRDADPSSRPPRPETLTVTIAIGQVIAEIKAAASTENIQQTVAFALKTLEKRQNGTPPGALADALRDVLKVLAEVYGPRS